jgi:hypothetical protein
MNSPTLDWLEKVRAAPGGIALLGFLKDRLLRPYEVGPMLDDRRGEGPEEVFEELARGDSDFRSRLEDALALFFKDPTVTEHAG